MRFRLQSAMEYLMTYGWAILIIAVVLGVLYYLGIFNGANFAPKLPPGSCQVARPDGPDTTQNINTEGECWGGLPQYVVQFSPTSPNVIVGNSLITGNQATFVVWFDEYGSSGDLIGQSGTLLNTCTFGRSSFEVENSIGGTSFFNYGPGTSCPTPGVWYQYAGVYNGVSVTMYIDGVAGTPGSQSGNLHSGYVYIGEYNVNGILADVQIYNTSLDANSIEALYQEGVGGVPIDLENLVGWWPLNGNIQDYSGNDNEGQGGSMNYISTWYYNYNQP